ncbi:MAG TPA: radical SAM protein [Candidatus Hydrogenedentes bacterium]|nr:radical SAM protein [Candidatus Hydrogenedentota bacterium]
MRAILYDAAFPNMGIQYILGTLKSRGYDADLYYDPSLSRDYVAQNFPFANYLSLSSEQVAEDILGMKPDIVGFSVHTLNYAANMELIRSLKRLRPDIVTVCGGIHATLAPKAVLDNKDVDFVVVGEGELSFPALIEALKERSPDEIKTVGASDLPGVWNRCEGHVVDRGVSPLVTNLDEIPFPEKALYHRLNPALRSLYMIMGSRGCVYRCTYCNVPTLSRLYEGCPGGPFYRIRTVENVMRELHMAMERFAPRQFEFWDTIFGGSRPWLYEFIQRYKEEIGIPYAIQTSPLLHNRETLQLLAESGCTTMELGFQAANAEVREKVLNRHETNDRVKHVVIEAERAGIGVELDFIVDLPGEVKEHVQESLDFVAETHPWKAYMFFLQYFPRVPIAEKALEAGILQPEDIAKLDHGEQIRSLRFSSRKLGDSYSLIPVQLLLACHLPTRWGKRMMRWVEKPVLRHLCALAGPPCMYLSHFFSALFDRKDTFTRHNLVRIMYSVRRVLRRKRGGSV